VHVSVLGGDAREVSERVHTLLPITDTSAETESLAGACCCLVEPVLGTPTLFVNGRRHHGAYDIATLSAAVRVAGARASLAGA
jgi:hypothetical protein